MPPEMQKETTSAVHAVMEKFGQPVAVRDQFLKLLRNLMEGNYDPKDVARMIEAVVVEDEKGG